MRSLATARTGGVVVISPAAGNRPGSGAGEGAFRRFPNHPLLLLTVLASLLLTLPATAAPSKPGELVVKTRKGTSVRNLAGGLVVSQAPAPGPGGTRVLSLAAGVSPEDAAARLRDRPGVVFAEPNYVIRKARVPDDPRYPEQWDLAGMGAATAWDYSTGANVVIAVVDTGIDYHHEDLAANLWTNPGEVPGDGKDNDGDGIVDDVYGARFKDGTVTGDPMDDDNWDSHGTSVAGIAAGVTDNGKGISGTGWGAPVMAVKVLHGGQGVGSVADAAAGIRYAVDHGAQVINLSFTVPARSLTLEDALSYADRHGALVVSAAGNSGADLDTNDVSPGGLPNPNNVTVAAALEDGTLAGYSNFGATAVDLAAPGGRASYDPSGILSTMAPAAGHGKYNYLAGTSVAAPHVAGLAALIWSLDPSLTQYQVKARLLNAASHASGLADRTLSGGAADAAESLVEGDRPAVFGVQPASAAPGDTVTVEGANFGPGPGKAYLGDTPMEIEDWAGSGTRIQARVPDCAVSGDLQVKGVGTAFPLKVRQAPTVSLEIPSNPVSPNQEAVFRADAADPGNGSLSGYEWDLGDGKFRHYDGFTTEASRAFPRTGTRTIRVRVTDSCGNTTIAAAHLKVQGGHGGGGCAMGGGSAPDPLLPWLGALALAGLLRRCFVRP